MDIWFHAAQFKPSLPPQASRVLFKNAVKYVAIETFTFCNRKCWFCPNVDMPFRQDRTGNQYIDDALYLRILHDLGSVEFAGQIQFGRYNEPLADRIILTHIRQARQHVPDSRLYVHSNGDYLTPAYLDELRSAGLNAICLQSYLGNKDHYDEDRMLARQQQQLKKLGLGIARTITSIPNVRHHHLTDYPGMQITTDARNFESIGTDRGGLVQVNVAKAVRTAPCLVPFTDVHIDWLGNTAPCCNIRSDRPEHQNYIVSKLKDGTSIFDAYVALYGWRKHLLRFGPKDAPCDTCNYEADLVPADQAPQLEAVYQQLASEAS